MIIFSLMKVVSCEKRAEQFLDGQLYCNTLRFLREKFDEYEGVIPLPGTLQINDRTFPKPLVSPDPLSRLNVFCMFAWAVPKEGDKILLDPKSQLGSLHTLAQTFGEYTVAVNNVSEFFRRANQAAKQDNGLKGCRGVVKYVEPTGEMPTTLSDFLNFALQKRKSFAKEKEYRFAYWTGRKCAGPFILNIGDIRDIAFRMKTEDVYDSITINGRPLSDF